MAYVQALFVKTQLSTRDSAVLPSPTRLSDVLLRKTQPITRTGFPPFSSARWPEPLPSKTQFAKTEYFAASTAAPRRAPDVDAPVDVVQFPVKRQFSVQPLHRVAESAPPLALPSARTASFPSNAQSTNAHAPERSAAKADSEASAISATAPPSPALQATKRQRVNSGARFDTMTFTETAPPRPPLPSADSAKQFVKMQSERPAVGLVT